MLNNTPLRYPGGKSLMTNFLIELFQTNQLGQISYAEPYAGGAGAAINLLLLGYVRDIHINDANIGVYSFWRYLTQYPNEFIERVVHSPVTIDEWFRQREVINNSILPSFDLGFATFFMTRTNRSGIIKAGPIGGNTEEKQLTAKYKIDCRFNKVNLIERLQKIALHANRIHVSCLDAIDFFKDLDRHTFVYLDPPYYQKGSCLYMNHYTHDEHETLSTYLINDAAFPWLLSYDDVPEIRNLYQNCDLYRFSIPYTVQNAKAGCELLTHSNNLIFPNPPMIRRCGKNILIDRI